MSLSFKRIQGIPKSELTKYQFLQTEKERSILCVIPIPILHLSGRAISLFLYSLKKCSRRKECQKRGLPKMLSNPLCKKFLQTKKGAIIEVKKYYILDLYEQTLPFLMDDRPNNQQKYLEFILHRECTFNNLSQYLIEACCPHR